MKMRSLRMLLDFLPPKLRLRMPTLLLQLSVSLRMLLGFLAHDRDEVAIWAEFRSASGDAQDAVHVADELEDLCASYHLPRRNSKQAA